MKRMIDVHTGEIMAGCGDVVLKSDANNACLVIAAYDGMKKIGCLAHALFISEKFEKRAHADVVQEASKTIDHAIEEMVSDMLLLGSNKNDIEVRLVAGENVPHQPQDEDYERKIHSAIDLMKQRQLKINPDQGTDPGSLHVSLDVSSGNISYV